MNHKLITFSKVGQCLREDAPGIRNEIEHGHSSDDEAGGATPKRKGKVATDAVTSQAPAPAPVHDSTRNGNAYAAQASGSTRQNQPWMHRQHSAPMSFHGHQPHAFSGQQQQHHGSNAAPYNMPATFYNGVRSTGNQFAKMSHMATEAMRHAAPSGMPGDQVAFGRVFTPTVRSSGSTVSSISGLSGLSGMEHGASATRTQVGSGSLRVSQLSDMTTSMMSLGSSLGLTRSNSLPELGLSKEFTSLSDASFAVLMEEEQVLPEEWAQPSNMLVSQLQDSSGTGTSGSSSNRPPVVPGVPPPPRNRTTSAVSAMSWASAGSQRSNLSSSARSSAGSDTSWLNPIRSRLTGSIHSDHSFCSSTR